MKFSIPDLINLTIIGSSSLFGLYSGFIHSLINFVSFTLSFVLAYLVHPHIHVIAQQYIANEIAQTVVAVLISYIASIIITSMTKSYIFKFTSPISYGFIDRVLGFGLGLIRGLLYSLTIFYLVMFFGNPKLMQSKNIEDFTTALKRQDYPKWFRESETANFTKQVSDILVSLLPHQILHYDLAKTPIESLINYYLKTKKVKPLVEKLDSDIPRSADFLDQEPLDDI